MNELQKTVLQESIDILENIETDEVFKKLKKELPPTSKTYTSKERESDAEDLFSVYVHEVSSPVHNALKWIKAALSDEN